MDYFNNNNNKKRLRGKERYLIKKRLYPFLFYSIYILIFLKHVYKYLNYCLQLIKLIIFFLILFI